MKKYSNTDFSCIICNKSVKDAEVYLRNSKAYMICHDCADSIKSKILKHAHDMISNGDGLECIGCNGSGVSECNCSEDHGANDKCYRCDGTGKMQVHWSNVKSYVEKKYNKTIDDLINSKTLKSKLSELIIKYRIK